MNGTTLLLAVAWVLMFLMVLLLIALYGLDYSVALQSEVDGLGR